MNAPDTVLLVVVVALALNQFVLRVDALVRNPFAFYGILLLDLCVGTYVLAVGLPGFEDAPAVPWVLGLMFFLHVAQNLSFRTRRLEGMAEDAHDARQAELREIADRIRDEG